MPRFKGWVVKLGGSLADSPWLASWLSALAHPEQISIVVPGGGRFADTVRAAQSDWGTHNDAAHAMAMLAMAQYGLALQARAPGLALARGLAELETQAPGRSTIWLPVLADQAALDAAGLPRDWTLTADSLALWLANRLEAEALLLVKAAEGEDCLACSPARLAALSAEGVLDAFLPGMPARMPVHVVSASRGPGILSRRGSSAP